MSLRIKLRVVLTYKLLLLHEHLIRAIVNNTLAKDGSSQVLTSDSKQAILNQ